MKHLEDVIKDVIELSKDEDKRMAHELEQARQHERWVKGLIRGAYFQSKMVNPLGPGH